MTCMYGVFESGARFFRNALCVKHISRQSLAWPKIFCYVLFKTRTEEEEYDPLLHNFASAPSVACCPR